MESEKEKRIRDRAYEIWEREGQPAGRHDEHWRQAEAELAAETQSEEGAAAAGNKPASDPADTSTAKPVPAAPAAPARRSRAASKSAPAAGKRERKPAE